MKWSPPRVEYKNSDSIRFYGSVGSENITTELTPLPSSFRDTPEMLKLCSPHILEEGRMSVHQEYVANSDRNGYWIRESFELRLQVSFFMTYEGMFRVKSLTIH